MPEVVVEMHARSGLTEEVRASSVTLAEAEKLVLDYVREHVPDARTAPLCGNSIATDRGFLARDMPALDDYLHYRMVDVSSLKELAKRWYPRVYQSQPEKGLKHRALEDIRESITELAYYRATLFVPQPGPSADEAQAAAEAVQRGAGGQVD
jgi:oligoribonuclease